MGTRADFYINRGNKAEWIASTAYDGYPCYYHKPGVSKEILNSKTEEEFIENLNAFFKKRDDVTVAEDGWPWPWENSGTTDYAYAFENGEVYISNYGRSWVSSSDYKKYKNSIKKLEKKLETSKNPDKVQEKIDELFALISPDNKDAIFPNMKEKMKVALGSKSGLLILGTK